MDYELRITLVIFVPHIVSMAHPVAPPPSFSSRVNNIHVLPRERVLSLVSDIVIEEGANLRSASNPVAHPKHPRVGVEGEKEKENVEEESARGGGSTKERGEWRRAGERWEGQQQAFSSRHVARSCVDRWSSVVAC